jgi:hypothetical protein
MCRASAPQKKQNRRICRYVPGRKEIVQTAFCAMACQGRRDEGPTGEIENSARQRLSPRYARDRLGWCIGDSDRLTHSLPHRRILCTLHCD